MLSLLSTNSIQFIYTFMKYLITLYIVGLDYNISKEEKKEINSFVGSVQWSYA